MDNPAGENVDLLAVVVHTEIGTNLPVGIENRVVRECGLLAKDAHVFQPAQRSLGEMARDAPTRPEQ